MSSLLVVGSMAYDDIETPFDKRKDALGGSATYFSTAASYFTPVNLVAVVGDDFNRSLINYLVEKKVNLEGLTSVTGQTFRWGGKYLDNMIDRETLYTHLGVFESFNPVLPASYQNSEYIFLANIQPNLQHNVIQQVKKAKFVAMDTMNFWITGDLDNLHTTLKKVDCLIINDSEVRLLSGEHNIFKGAQKIRELGPQTLIIKKGEHGSILVSGDKYFMCPAFPVENLFDPTGAGDSFAGGFMGYLAATDLTSPENLRRAMIVGTVMASFCVESFSTDKLKTLNEQEIKSRIHELVSLFELERDNIWI